MDWALAVTTLFVNSLLGWWKGHPIAWALHALNATFWVVYAVVTEQFGFAVLSVVTIAIDVVSGYRSAVKRGGLFPWRDE